MSLRSLLAAAALLSTPLLAHADNYSVFELTSTFVGFMGEPGGGLISGTLTLDTTSNTFTSVDLTASGFPFSSANATLTSFGNGSGGFGSAGVVVTGSGNTLNLYLMASTLVGYTGSGICSESSSPACYINDLTGYLPGNGSVFVASSGTLEPETVTPTPELSSFLLLATGMLGVAVLSLRPRMG